MQSLDVESRLFGVLVSRCTVQRNVCTCSESRYRIGRPVRGVLTMEVEREGGKDEGGGARRCGGKAVV